MPNQTTRQIDPDRKAKRGWRARVAGSPVLIFSLILHILFAILAGYFIVSRTQQKRKQNFTEVNVTAVTPQIEHKLQMTKMQNAQSAPAVTQRIITNELSEVNLPEVTVPSDNPGDGSAKMGAAVVGGSGDKTGIGGGGSPMNIDMTTMVTAFGFNDGNGLGLRGHFYDLKQTPARTSTDMSIGKYGEVVADFINQGWPTGYFHKYFEGPKPLYLSQLFIPLIDASQGPKAYHLEDLVEPKMWVIVYRGKFKVEHRGTYRFVGIADDVLDVSVNHKMVLEGSLHNSTSPHGHVKFANTDTYQYKFPITISNPGYYRKGANLPFGCGAWVTLDENEYNDISIIIGEQPGGHFGCWLLVEEKGKVYQKTPEGNPILQMFKVSNVALPSADKNSPPYDHTDLGWTTTSEDDDEPATASQN